MRSALNRKYSWLQARIATLSSHSWYGAKTPGSASLQRKSRHYTILDGFSKLPWTAKVEVWGDVPKSVSEPATFSHLSTSEIRMGDHRKYMLLWRVHIGGDWHLTAGAWSSWVSPSNRWRQRNLKRCFSSSNSRHLVSRFAVRADVKILLELRCCDFPLQSHIPELDREPPG